LTDRTLLSKATTFNIMLLQHFTGSKRGGFVAIVTD